MNTASYKATVGTISHGTMRTEDLLISISDELRRLQPDHELVKECEAIQTLWAAGWNDIYDNEHASETLDALFDAMEEFAPPYCYFGANEGDGSDYGFWPSMEAIEELPRIQMAEGEDVPAEDHCYVNDHGNVTVFAADGSVILELV